MVDIDTLASEGPLRRAHYKPFPGADDWWPVGVRLRIRTWFVSVEDDKGVCDRLTYSYKRTRYACFDSDSLLGETRSSEASWHWLEAVDASLAEKLGSWEAADTGSDSRKLPEHLSFMKPGLVAAQTTHRADCSSLLAAVDSLLSRSTGTSP
jgi:hypothetical protein